MMSLLMFLLFGVYCKIKTVDFVPKTINMIYAILLNVVRSPVFKNKTVHFIRYTSTNLIKRSHESSSIHIGM